jgi:hypothetical protein
VSTVCIVDEFLRSVYDPPLENFHDVLNALSEAQTLSTDHSEAVAATLLTILDLPDSSDVLDHLLNLMSGLASQTASGRLVETLLILAEKVLLINGDYYDQLVDGILGFLWEILGRELRHKSSPIWPGMSSLMHCAIATFPEARGPFSLNAALEIPPVDYMRSTVACVEPAQVAQWFDIFARLARDAPGFQLLLEVARYVFVQNAPFQMKVVWLTAWHDHAFTGYAVLFELFWRSCLIGEFSWLIDSRNPALALYFELLDGILQSGLTMDSECLLAAFFDCGPDGFSVFHQLVRFLDDAVGDQSHIWQQALAIHDILDPFNPGERVCDLA